MFSNFLLQSFSMLTYFCFLIWFQFLHAKLLLSSVLLRWKGGQQSGINSLESTLLNVVLEGQRISISDDTSCTIPKPFQHAANSELRVLVIVITLIIIKSVLACLRRTEGHSFRHTITHRALLGRALAVQWARVVYRAVVQLIVLTNDLEQRRNLVERSVLRLGHSVVGERPEDGYEHGEGKEWIRLEHTLWGEESRRERSKGETKRRHAN